jgi:hypothetical protein
MHATASPSSSSIHRCGSAFIAAARISKFTRQPMRGGLVSVVDAPMQHASGGSDGVEDDYWLSHCEGYRVESSGGRIGLVEEVRRAADNGQAESLAVLAGIRGLRRLVIPVSEIALVVPHDERLVLKERAEIASSERLRRGRSA